MRSFVSKAKVGALVTGCLASALLAHAAWSDIRMVSTPGVLQYRWEWNVFNPPPNCGYPPGKYAFLVFPGPASPHREDYYQNCEPPVPNAFNEPRAYFYMDAAGNKGCQVFSGATGGGKLTTTAAGTGYQASIGAWTAENTPIPGPAPGGVPMGLGVDRLTANQITLTFTGGMEVQGGGTRPALASYHVLVYPNTATAYADSENWKAPSRTDPQHDVRHAGTGAIFHGRVTLTPGMPRAVGGSFLEGDWTNPAPVGNLRSTAYSGPPKVLNGAGLDANAVVVEVSDPLSDPGAVPGASPIVLVLITVALLGSGIWVIRLRSRPATA
jgi:hypothetical protein